MLDGVAGGSPFAHVAAVAVVGVASLLVYRDAQRHGHYHALSATAAVAIAGLVGISVGGVVGLFVGTGYVLLLYLLSYPSTPTVDPETEPSAADGRPQGDAGENLGGDDDVVSVIRVEIASYETLQELARRYDDVPNDGTESELRSQLRVKALSHVRETIDGEDGDEADPTEAGADGLGDWTEPREPADTEDPSDVRQRQRDLAATETVAEGGIEEWSAEEPPSESVGEYGAAEWSSERRDPDERVGDYGAEEWTESGFEPAPEHAANGSESAAAAEDSTADGGVWGSTGEETEAPQESGMEFGNVVERESAADADADTNADASVEAETCAEAETGCECEGDGDPFDGRGELHDGDETEAEPEQAQY